MANFRRNMDALTLPFPWRQGEHMAVIGDTGTGKSTLMERLSLSRSYVVMVRTKPDDVKWPGKKVRTTRAITRDITDPDSSRWVLEPSGSLRERYVNQRREIDALFERAFKEGGWTLALDETFYIDNILKMRGPLQMMLTQGRSLSITLMMGIQRPVDVSRFVLSSSSHIIVFRQDGRDAETVSKAAAKDVRPYLDTLPPRHFLWYYRPTRQLWAGTLDLPRNELRGDYIA